MTDRVAIAEAVAEQIAPFNKKGVALTDATTFQHDLEWDSLTVMDFVAAAPTKPTTISAPEIGAARYS